MECPKCKSENIIGGKQGFSGGKAALGAIAVGPLGLVAGSLGSSKVKLTCAECGLTWKAGEHEKMKRKIQAEQEFNDSKYGAWFVIIGMGVLIYWTRGFWWWLFK